MIFIKYTLKLDFYGNSMYKICKQEKGNIAYIHADRYKEMNILTCSCGNAWE